MSQDEQANMKRAETNTSTEKQVRVEIADEDGAGSSGKKGDAKRGGKPVTTSQSHTDRVGRADNVGTRLRDRGPVTSTPIKKVTVEGLKEQLRKLKLPTTGSKAELQRRLEDYQNVQEESDVDSDSEDNTIIENDACQEPDEEAEEEDDQEAGGEDNQEETDEDEGPQRVQTRRSNIQRRPTRNTQVASLNTRNTITIKDVEDSISHFSGDDQLQVERWTDEFEDMSELLQWSDLQKIIYAKKLLRGSAKQFMALQKGLTTWKAMKKRLLGEFQTRYNSATVHAQLIKRKRLPNETPRQYIYAMQTIASLGEVEEEAIIRYAIDGIHDEENNKIILYGSRNIMQLRKNLEVYDRMKERMDRRPQKEKMNIGKGKAVGKNERRTNPKENKGTRCFTCGSDDHIARDCPHKDEGPKCFKCNRFGHVAAKCDTLKGEAKKERKVNVVNMGNCVPTDDQVMVIINNIPVLAMIDTGTRHTLLRFSEYQRIGKPAIRIISHSLYGLGNSQVIPNGIFWADITIQEEQYRTEVYVVPNDAMDEKMLLGKGLTRQMDIRMKGGVLSIKKLEDEIKEEESVKPQIDRKKEGEGHNDDERQPQRKSEDEIEENDEEKDDGGKREIESKRDINNYKGAEQLEEKSSYEANRNGEGEQESIEEAMRELHAVNYTETDVPDINPKYHRQIHQLIDSYNPKRRNQTNVETQIVLRDEVPVSLKPRRLAIREKAILDAQIEEWLHEGVIQPSNSNYSSPVVIVPKKNGAYRVCVDYRQLNKKIIRDRFPMPRTDDCIDALAEAQFFSVLDLKNGFFHVPVAKESRRYTSFVTSDGQYEFLKTPFGLCNSPTSFLRFIDEIFHDLSKKNVVLTYMDDLIVPGKNEREALANLKETLAVAAEGGLTINWRKCEFLQRRVEYLGHVIENGQISPSPMKVKAVRKFPVPKTKKAIQCFLGLTGYFRKFIQNYAKIAKPLSDILKKNQRFRLEGEQQRAFEQLKSILTTEPILQIYRPDAITELHTDASKEGYGAVILQKQKESDPLKPVHYMSRKTTDSERNYHSYELEALAVIQAVKKFRVYLLGLRFKIVTDCAAFQKTLNKADITPKVARWALVLEEFDYEIEHRSSTRLRHVDALSRYPVMMVKDRLTPVIRKQQNEEERLRIIKKILEKEPHEDYSCEDGILMKRVGHKNVVVLPTSMHHDLIHRVHENGHFGVKKMMESIQNEYYIPKLKEKLEKYVSCCVPCILAERKRGRKEGELRPIPKGEAPLSTYHVDHLGPMTTTPKLYKYLFVVIDSFSKFVWIYPTKTTSTKEVLEKLKSQQKIFGNPRRIISDRGSAFTSQDFQSYCIHEDIEHVLITTGVPRGNGQVERINRVIIPILTKLTHSHPDQWYRLVDRVQTAINSTYQRSIGTSPFEVLLGVRMRRKEDPEVLSIIELESVAAFEEERRELRKLAQENIAQVQHENKRTHARKSKPATQYNVGELVAIKRKQYGPGMKLKNKYLGPYKVSQVKGNDRYEVTKETDVEGPWITSSSADQMKPYSYYSSGTEEEQEWPNVGAISSGRVTSRDEEDSSAYSERSLKKAEETKKDKKEEK